MLLTNTLIKIIRDKLNSDDYIGTCFINLPEVSAQGDQGTVYIVID